MRERVLAPLGDALVFLLCYLVLSACGWAIDHVGVTEAPEPAPC